MDSLDSPDFSSDDSPPENKDSQMDSSSGPHRFTRREARYGKRGSQRPSEKKSTKEAENKPVSPSVQRNLLYGEALYTIIHRIGTSEPDHISDNEQLYEYLQVAFNMDPAEHNAILESVKSLEPPIICVKVTVKQAKGILGKDVSVIPTACWASRPELTLSPGTVAPILTGSRSRKRWSGIPYLKIRHTRHRSRFRP
ncbi:uncharacterized protein RB166_012120 [Leptodactylus fuscus]